MLIEKDDDDDEQNQMLGIWILSLEIVCAWLVGSEHSPTPS